MFMITTNDGNKILPYMTPNWLGFTYCETQLSVTESAKYEMVTRRLSVVGWNWNFVEVQSDAQVCNWNIIYLVVLSLKKLQMQLSECIVRK